MIANNFKKGAYMEILALWFITCIASFIMEILNDLKLLKDIADVGYKVDLKQILEIRNQIHPELSKITPLSMLMPIINIVQGFQKMVFYDKKYLLDNIDRLDGIEKMTEEEKTNYLKNPIGIQAFLISFKLEMERLSSQI